MGGQRIVIVGASLAGFRAAEELRHCGHDGPIALVGDEPHRPYDRPPLSKQVLAGTKEPADAALSVASGAVDDLQLDWHLGAIATGLDRRDGAVLLGGGDRLPYDGLVIATGASPRRLPGTDHLDGVHTLRTVDDCLAIRSAFERGPRRVAVVGAGFIGAEVAATCRGLGLEVSLIEALPVPLERGLGAAMGAVMADLHRDHGVDVRLGVGVVLIEGDDRVERVRLTDGTFWVADENGPSIAHIAADGRINTRYVPLGTEKQYEGARYEVIGSLPAILARRQSNRGIEALAISPDERFLYFIMQSPLANPDSGAFRKGRNVRLFKLERTSMQIVGEYVYVMDDPKSFRRDPSSEPARPRISEMVAVGLDRLIVLERTEATTKLYEIDLAAATDINGSPWDDPKTEPSLEQIDLRNTAIVPLRKTLQFDSADFPSVPGKIEGVALFADGALALINDDDFGVDGARTQIVVLRGLDITDR